MRQGALRWLSPAGFFRLVWTAWGPAESDSPPVVCVHGLLRTGRDFDGLAAALASRGRRVLCPDMPGRGASDRLPDPALYRNDVYAAACAHLLAHLGEGPVDWVGTSMGGIVGMILAAQPNTPIRRLVLNDIGALVPAAAIARIAAYAQAFPTVADLDEAEAAIRRLYAPFGDLPDAVWRHLAATSFVPSPSGLRPHFDPAIAQAFAGTEAKDVDLSPLWSAVRAETLILRGEHSDVLPAEVAARMAEGPHVRVVTIAGCGHAPALWDEREIALVARFLEHGHAP